MNTDKRPSWDEYFMHLAEESALRSKDPNTKVGACIVKDNRVLSLGYNGAPRGFDDDLVPLGRGSNLPLAQRKNTFMCHAELNSILNYCKINLLKFIFDKNQQFKISLLFEFKKYSKGFFCLIKLIWSKNVNNKFI